FCLLPILFPYTTLFRSDYSVEWRVINAAEYGRSQRRRRLFFFIYRNDTEFAQSIDSKYEEISMKGDLNEQLYDNYIFKDGLFAKQFPIKNEPYKNRRAYYQLPSDIVQVSDDFTGKVWNTGVMRHNRYFTIESIPYGDELPIPLGKILQEENKVDKRYYLTDEKRLAKFK